MVVHLALVLGCVDTQVILQRLHLPTKMAILIRVQLAPVPAVATTLAATIAVGVPLSVSVEVWLVLPVSSKAERVSGVVLSVDVRLRDVSAGHPLVPSIRNSGLRHGGCGEGGEAESARTQCICG